MPLTIARGHGVGNPYFLNRVTPTPWPRFITVQSLPARRGCAPGSMLLKTPVRDRETGRRLHPGVPTTYARARDLVLAHHATVSGGMGGMVPCFAPSKAFISPTLAGIRGAPARACVLPRVLIRCETAVVGHPPGGEVALAPSKTTRTLSAGRLEIATGPTAFNGLKECRSHAAATD